MNNQSVFKLSRSFKPILVCQKSIEIQKITCAMSNESEAKLVIALDVGSSSIRCTPYHITTTSVSALHGCSVAKQRASVHPNTGKIALLNPENGNLVEDQTLFEDIDACIDDTLHLLRPHYNQNTFQIAAVGISSFVMNLIGIDQFGLIVGEECTLSYACNSIDVVEEISRLKRELSEEKLNSLYQTTGAPLHNAYAIGQLRVLYNHTLNSSSQTMKNNLDVTKVDHWTTIASYCLQRWSGKSKIPISYSEASWTGLFNFHTCKWDDECCNLLPKSGRSKLPETVDNKNNYFYIEEFVHANDNGVRKRNPYWDRWPELRGSGDNLQGKCKLTLGVGDGVCANIGSKCSTPERIACTIGTSAAARVCLPYKIRKQDRKDDEFIVPFGLFCYRVDEEHVLLGGALTDGGSIIEFFRQLVNLEEDEPFNRCLSDATMKYKRDIGGCGMIKNKLSVIPFLSGERSTGFRGGASGSILGLTRETTTSDLLRSCLGGVVLRLNQILTLIESNKPNMTEPSKCIVASGNALERNSLWRQMLADCTGKRVVSDSDANEGTSRGVAVLMSHVLNEHKTNKMEEEILVIKDEELPNCLSEQFWSKQKEYQDSAINCISTLWK